LLVSRVFNATVIGVSSNETFLPSFFTCYFPLVFGQMDDGPKETATSSEFDAFLATREKEANSTTSNSGTSSNHGGRTLQNAEEDQALFSL